MSEEPAITSIPGPPPESDFGQEYSLLKALNKLVRDYALGVGLFKEFIQNADDAEATEIRFILDQTSQTAVSSITRNSHSWLDPLSSSGTTPPSKTRHKEYSKPWRHREGPQAGQHRQVRPRLQHLLQRHRLPSPAHRSQPLPFRPTQDRLRLLGHRPTRKVLASNVQLWSTSPDLLTSFRPLGLLSGQSEFPVLPSASRSAPQTMTVLMVRLSAARSAPTNPRTVSGVHSFCPLDPPFLKHLLRIEFMFSPPPAPPIFRPPH